MKPTDISALLAAVAISVLLLFPGSRASAAVATQNISFNAGWNAIWLGYCDGTSSEFVHQKPA